MRETDALILKKLEELSCKVDAQNKEIQELRKISKGKSLGTNAVGKFLNKNPPTVLVLQLNGQPVQFLLDSGAAISIIRETVFNEKLKPNGSLLLPSKSAGVSV